MTKDKKLPLRTNVCILLQNSDGDLWLGERLGSKNEWQFPQGGAKKKYSLEENVLRELEEELGLLENNLKIEKKLDVTHEYDWVKTPEYAMGRYRGQSQTFWLVSFTGRDSDINIKTEHPEFMDWKWCDPKNVLETVHPIRVEGYKKALNELKI